MLRSTTRLCLVVALVGCCLILWGCRPKESPAGSAESERAAQPEAEVPEQQVRDGQIWSPDGGDHLWVFAESKDNLGPGGEFHIYVDPETHPHARASFAKFSLGVGGALLLIGVVGKVISGYAVGYGHVKLNHLAIGVGMIPRGEVGLIFAGIGASLVLRGQPVISVPVFSAVAL